MKQHFTKLISTISRFYMQSLAVISSLGLPFSVRHFAVPILIGEIMDGLTIGNF